MNEDIFMPGFLMAFVGGAALFGWVFSHEWDTLAQKIGLIGLILLLLSLPVCVSSAFL